ncbi:MAG: GMC family oxidoreductase [Gemmatimonadales bacterium]|nr:GMC family oxidoreductase [Gemmatimonadales bacterium]
MHPHPDRTPKPAWAAPTGATFRTRDQVDFVVIGAGSAGGIVARELARAGFSVVVLEQGPYFRADDFGHDEIAVNQLAQLTNDHQRFPNSWRPTEDATAVVQPVVRYGRMVGGGSNHYTGNFWRFHEIDFIERSRKGTLAGTGFDDWPITYADLEPYYTRVEWEIGVSGLAGSSPFDPPRSRPYPMPPLPRKSIGVLAEKAARAMGWTAYPAPMAINSVAYNGRPACIQCGFCLGYGCEVHAKSSTLATMIPDAERTGRCQIRPMSTVTKIETDRRGRVTGVQYLDAGRRGQFQRAKAVFLCANGAESPRLLLLSATSRHPDGLANASGMVGRHLMFNGAGGATAVFDHEVNGYRGMVDTRIIHDMYELDPALGLIGGGGFDFRFAAGPIGFATRPAGQGGPRWGAEWKRNLRRYYTQSLNVAGHTTQLPLPTNRITLDPDLKDANGLPAIRVTFQDHPQDLQVMEWFRARAVELAKAAGASEIISNPVRRNFPQVHLLGTCRMGHDPRTSVVNASHRAHDVPNLFIVDGSSFVTSGRGQPTMTIMALAFRAAEHAARLAKQGALA